MKKTTLIIGLLAKLFVAFMLFAVMGSCNSMMKALTTEFDQELTLNLEAGKYYIISGKRIERFNNTARYSNLE